MIVIYRPDGWRLVDAPQNVEEAFKKAKQLEQKTGIRHYVGRV